MEKVAGSSIEHTLASVTHYGLYGFMTIMPATGIAMGYYSGKGLPFFFTTIPGVVKTDENKARTGGIAKQVRIFNFLFFFGVCNLIFCFSVLCFLAPSQRHTCTQYICCLSRKMIQCRAFKFISNLESMASTWSPPMLQVPLCITFVDIQYFHV